MKLPIPNARESALFKVLKYCSDLDKRSNGVNYVFTVTERICINRERGAILSQLNPENIESEIRYYQVPPQLEEKIKFIIQKVID
jgi:hypothetical protein